MGVLFILGLAMKTGIKMNPKLLWYSVEGMATEFGIAPLKHYLGGRNQKERVFSQETVYPMSRECLLPWNNLKDWTCKGTTEYSTLAACTHSIPLKITQHYYFGTF